VSFLALIARNLVRQRMRTALTVLGIAVGIMTVVALGVVTSGMRGTLGSMLRTGGADFMVAQKGASDLSFSSLPQRDWDAVRRVPGVQRAVGAALEVSKIGGNPYFLTFGFDPRQLAADPLEVLAGRRLVPGASGELMLGQKAARDLDAEVGATVRIEGRSFRVVGVYRTGEHLRDAGALAALADVQALSGKPGLVTAVFVYVARGADTSAVAAAIERRVAGVVAIEKVSEYSQVDQGMEILDAVNVAISVLAVGIGAIGVMNTMIMSVFERTRELGILRAVGWRGRRVMRMVVTESLLLCLVAAALGMALGVLASRAVLLVPAVSSFLTPDYGAAIFARALAVGVVVALVGAAYPALRAVRLSPMEALRHE
jgi:putative ABC transport system permease protein